MKLRNCLPQLRQSKTHCGPARAAMEHPLLHNEYWIVIASTLASALLSLNSYALWSHSRAKLGELFPAHRGRMRMDWLEAHLEPLQIALLLCRLACTALVAMSFVSLISNPNAPLSLATMGWALAATIAILGVFSVTIPRILATHRPESVLRRCFVLLVVVRWLCWPITALLMLMHTPALRLIGEDEPTDEDAEEEARAEIIQAADDAHAEGAMDADEVDMIESVMEFSDTDAAEIMTPRTDLFALDIATDFQAAIDEVCAHGHTRVPVFRETIDNIIGILYAKDLLAHVSAPPATIESIIRKPWFVPETKPLDDLLAEFKARKVHLAVVLDEYGGTAGLVSIEDVLEEIVGEISDEFDEAEPQLIRRLTADSLEVDGRLRVDELNDELQLQLPEDEDFDTVAGYVVAQLGYIPTNGEILRSHNAEFTILDADERKISTLHVKRTPDETREE